jgi:hypothetical protein
VEVLHDFVKGPAGRPLAAKKVLARLRFAMQSIGMESNWAAEHLQVIRTLMERSALYRRALAPIMIFAGILGLVAALVGWKLSIYQPSHFVGYWYCVGALGVIGAFVMVRRQAWQQSEPFWSPPTRRVAQAMLPPLTAGFALGLLMLVPDPLPTEVDAPTGAYPPTWIVMICLPLAWVILYGCALHAAGFFMSRGMRLFGWIVVLGGCAAFLAGAPRSGPALLNLSYAIMGFFFGGLHLAYGVYLYFTEPRRNEP